MVFLCPQSESMFVFFEMLDTYLSFLETYGDPVSPKCINVRMFVCFFEKYGAPVSPKSFFLKMILFELSTKNLPEKGPVAVSFLNAIDRAATKVFFNGFDLPL